MALGYGQDKGYVAGSIAIGPAVARPETHMESMLNRLINLSESINGSAVRLHQIADAQMGPMPQDPQKAEPNAPTPSHMVFRMQEALNVLARQAQLVNDAANRLESL